MVKIRNTEKMTYDALFDADMLLAQPSMVQEPRPTFDTGSVYSRMSLYLDSQIDSEVDVVKLVNFGLPISAFKRLDELISIDFRLLGPETTIRRRLQEKQNFTVDESERLVRLARIAAKAEALFGDSSAAKAWLATRADYLSDGTPISPLELATTDSGARLVETLMLRTAHGIF